MLDELRGTRLLDGVRGRPPVDRAAVATLVAACRRLAIARPDLVEVDLNPVIATPDGAVAVDALVVLDGDPRSGPMPDEPRPPRRRPTPWGVRLTLNRPAKLNALDGALVDALVAALDAAEADAAVRVIVLEGAGRAFSAGYDLTEEAEGSDRRPGRLARAPRRRRRARPCGSSTRPSRSSPRSTAMPWPAAWSWRWPATSSSRPRGPSSASPRSATGRRRSRC